LLDIYLTIENVQHSAQSKLLLIIRKLKAFYDMRASNDKDLEHHDVKIGVLLFSAVCGMVWSV
jgi:hypothetical protein